jgi:hypothetical protein
MNEMWPWLTLAFLGAYHGLNPAMGWLFAVALGLQEQRRGAVIRAFAPIALGHALSIAVVVALVGAAQVIVAPHVLRIVAASSLLFYGLYKLFGRTSHPRWVGMRVNFRDLTGWSFLMASAHGAGLMLVPILLQLAPRTVCDPAHCMHSAHSAHAAPMVMASTVVTMPAAELAAVAIHTIAMFVVMALIAVVVYDKVGLAILRRAWFNLDRVWAGALIVTGMLSLVI